MPETIHERICADAIAMLEDTGVRATHVVLGWALALQLTWELIGSIRDFPTMLSTPAGTVRVLVDPTTPRCFKVLPDNADAMRLVNWRL